MLGLSRSVPSSMQKVSMTKPSTLDDGVRQKTKTKVRILNYWQMITQLVTYTPHSISDSNLRGSMVLLEEYLAEKKNAQ